MSISPAVQSRRGGAPVWLVGAIALVLVLVIRARAEVTPPEAKTHTLFMGMDLEVKRGSEYKRVTDVEGGSFILRIDDKIVRVPVSQEVGLRITQGLKLATVSAGIKDLKYERAYTLENDPRRKWTALHTAMAGGAADTVQGATRGMANADWGVRSAVAAQSNAGSYGGAALQAQVDEANRAAASASQNLNNSVAMASTMSDQGFYYRKMEEELKEELYDAVDVSFEISSAKPLASPYVIVVVQFRAPDAPKDTAQNWIYAEAIERLDAQARTVHIKRGGFPRGYTMERFQVHVYDRGREVASTVAPKRVELTSSEAYDYLLIEHLAAHKGKAAAAAVALGNLPADLRQKLPSGDIGRTFYAKVNKEGVTEGVFTDEKCLNALDENYTASVIRNMRFLPALEKGKPVDGVANVRLNDVKI